MDEDGDGFNSDTVRSKRGIFPPHKPHGPSFNSDTVRSKRAIPGLFLRSRKVSILTRCDQNTRGAISNQ